MKRRINCFKIKQLITYILTISVITINIQCQRSKASNINFYSTPQESSRLPMMSNSNVQPRHFNPGKINFRWPEGKKMGLSLTFDDARLTQVDNGIPLLDKYDVKATFYISPGNMIKRMDRWRKAVSNGHEIGNHSLSHPCSGNFTWSGENALENQDLQTIKMDLDSASRFIKEKLGIHPLSFAYPCGQTFVGRGINTKSYIPVVELLFETGRGWLDEGANDPEFCDMSQLTGIELDGKSFEEILKLIETAKNKGHWLILAGHEISKDETRQTSLLSTIEAICQYATDPANGIWIDNVHNIASYIREERGEKPFSERPVYKNPLFSIDARVTDLLSRMTLEEKIGQMNMPSVYLKQLGKDIDSKRDGCLKFAKGTKEQGIGPGGGFFTLPNTILHEGPRQQAEFHNELQRMAIENTRLGIPLLMTEEGTHGLACSGGTIFPEGLALGSTWNMDMVKDIYSVAAKEARAIGIHQLFTLVVEPNRDPRLGRNEEGYSEDPYLCSRIARAIVTGTQGADVSAPDKVIAGLCHFPGQSQPVGGLERGAMDVSERKLREVFLPPWVEGISKSGALGVMATYPAINGVPAHSSEKLLTKILREELGFEGLVLGEGRGITSLVYEHAVSSQNEAGAVALKAGVDVGISYEGGFMEAMKENISEGRVNVSLIDRSVSRILRQKFRLGLFENPYVNPDHAVKVSNSAENRELALQSACEGIVLLKNENGLLPLHKDVKSIAVIGPNANDERNQLGDYTSRIILQNVVTALEGIKSKVSSDTRVTYVKGCNVIGHELDEIKNAAEAAKNADVAIVVVGESHTGEKTNGEGYDVASLDLTGLQEDLLKAVHGTGTPTVVVLINGRPLSVRWTAENIPAIIEAWNCGEQGGNAVADVLFGDYNPNGRLPITFPRHVGQLPVYYNYMPSKSYWINSGMGKAYVDMPASPLWEFGFGLSYTTFEYSNLQITPEEIGSAGEIWVSVDIKNIGKKDGKEVVQLYMNDAISSVSKPVKELKGFEKISLAAGEKKTVRFKLTPEHLSLLDEHLEPVVEPGIFEVMVGSSSGDIRLFGKFKVDI